MPKRTTPNLFLENGPQVLSAATSQAHRPVSPVESRRDFRLQMQFCLSRLLPPATLHSHAPASTGCSGRAARLAGPAFSPCSRDRDNFLQRIRRPKFPACQLREQPQQKQVRFSMRNFCCANSSENAPAPEQTAADHNQVPGAQLPRRRPAAPSAAARVRPAARAHAAPSALRFSARNTAEFR